MVVSGGSGVVVPQQTLICWPWFLLVPYGTGWFWRFWCSFGLVPGSGSVGSRMALLLGIPPELIGGYLLIRGQHQGHWSLQRKFGRSSRNRGFSG